MAAVAVEPVAVRLGVSKGSFYWHFANRQALVDAALGLWEEETGAIIAALKEVGDPAARLRALLDLAFSSPHDAAVSLRLVGEADERGVAAVARRVSERRLAFMREALEELGQPPEVAAERLRECADLQEPITQAARDALIGTTVEVLVDSVTDDALVGRTHREAPEIDGVLRIAGAEGRPGAVVPAEVVGAVGPDLDAVPVMASAARR